MELKNKKILVVGLARTGASVARFLTECGARVTVSDSKGQEELSPFLKTLSALDIAYELGGHGADTFLAADLIVVSPGVPMDIAPLTLARNQGIPVISEIELAYEFIDAPIAAITGTNGKTTTTTLVGEIFRKCGFRTFVGGNIGNPLIDLVISGERTDRVVAEISSFQLEGIVRFRPRVAVLLNITEDHLDRYTSYQEYIDAKLRVFANQTADDFAILNSDDPLVAACAGKISAQVVPMSRLTVLEQGIFYHNGLITFAWNGQVAHFPTESFKLRGVHNIDNCMAALATTLLMGCPAATAMAAVAGFSGLPHRMEQVATINGVTYYNDSKGTNVGSVVKSLESFPGNITLIAGGKDKGGEYAPLADLVRERVSHLILLGEARERIRDALGHLTDTILVDSLEAAVQEAHRLAKPGDVVLFSPACSSFDMFRNYEVRGERFVSAVRALIEGAE
ncbi:MAG: UDP-N-acetylmuramoyl-L-alanine--D-glutamate ligase [Deltaproteobacteria bacterium]|nr:UDP-N-acetylmuramoyl-L-alanine--D-glutamate ligase [Deltaproteobacteria bacterium]